MRLTILGLLFCAATTALGQATAPSPASPDNLWQAPLLVTPPARDFTKLPPWWQASALPPGWQASAVAPPRFLFQPKVPGAPQAETGSRLGDAEIDPKIIVHPPQSSIGVIPPGTPMAQNEYPHLQMLPIESSAGIHEK
jgi:hypothetical protein